MGKKKKEKKEKNKEKRIEAPAAADFSEESKRLKRVIGQIEGIRAMLEKNRALGDVLNQCKAVHSALRSVESMLLTHYLGAALDSIAKAEKKKSREEQVAELESLFRQAS